MLVYLWEKYDGDEEKVLYTLANKIDIDFDVFIGWLKHAKIDDYYVFFERPYKKYLKKHVGKMVIKKEDFEKMKGC